MKPGMTIALALSLGLAIGAASDRFAMQSPAGAMPAQMNTSMSMHHGMMRMAKSPADKEMMAGMMRMHDSMTSMKLTGNSDRDFMTMMIPHHQAAIDMAKVELKYGKDARVKGLASGIITAQKNEIAEMKKWLEM